MVRPCRQKVSAFCSSKYSLTSYSPVTHCDHTAILIPIKIWAAQNNYSYWQARNLVKKRLLIAKKHKRRWYVAATPYFQDEVI